MKTKVSRCPSCQHKLSAVTRVVGKGKPEPGTITLCSRCGSLLCFSRSLRVRLLTEPELRKLPKDQLVVLRKLQRAIAQLRVDRGACSYCHGNDRDMPCAYPSEGKPGCLRDARLAAEFPNVTD